MSRPGAPTPIFSMGLPNPVPIVTRPLLGIDWRGSELNLPEGALLEAQNVIVRPKGLYRSPGYDSFLAGAQWSPSDIPCGLAAGWGTNGIQYPYLFTQNYVFSCDWASGYTRIPWTYTTGTLDTSGTSVTGHSTAWKTVGIKPGDAITISSVVYTVYSVATDTSLTLTSSAGTQTGKTYSISRNLGANTSYIVDTCEVWDLTLGQYLIAASPGNQVLALNPYTQTITNLTPTSAKQPTSGGFTAEAVVYFAGRVFAGNLNDGTNGVQRTLIRWSKATDTTDFSDATAYINLMSQGSEYSGAIRRLVPLGTLLIVYLDDAIFIGTPGNTVNLPLAFQQLPTSGVGLVGTRAVASTFLPGEGGSALGHFFVSQDNVYFMSASSLRPEPIGNRIIRESIAKCQYPNRIQTSVDWANKRVRFGFPRANAYIENIFDFDWETKEWSQEPRTTWLIGDLATSALWSPQQMVTVTGDGMFTTLGDAMCISWGVGVDSLEQRQFVEHGGAFWTAYNGTQAIDPDGLARAVLLETPDYDEGSPGLVKFWKMLRLKLSWDVAPAIDITFSVELSTDRGRTYRSVGNLIIRAGNDEGYVNFRATGPHIRFRLQSSSAVTPYYIVEMTRLASIRGVQSSLRQQNAVH
jgi:hypothetical protein